MCAGSADLKDLKIEHYHNDSEDGGIKARLRKDFFEADGLIFISSAGIAVRMLKDFIGGKETDPAVIVIDDTARFVIPILSGHLGGANYCSRIIAGFLGAQCVITTASDNRNIEAVDIFAQRCNYTIVSMTDAKTVTAMMVNGKKIGFYSEDLKKTAVPEDSENADAAGNGKNYAVIKYGNLVFLNVPFNDNKDKTGNPADFENIEGLILVGAESVQSFFPPLLPRVILVPRRLNLGIGLRKGVAEESIREAAELALKSAGRKLAEVSGIASIELKKDEQGLKSFAKSLSVPLKIFSAEEIRKAGNVFEGSAFVEKITGVCSVSAPCACLLGGKLIVEKFKHSGVTISVSEI